MPQSVRTEDGCWTRLARSKCEAEDLQIEFAKNNIQTIGDGLSLTVKKFCSYPCMGTRELKERHYIYTAESYKGNKAGPTEKLVLGNYKFKTFTEVNVCVNKFALGLLNLGLQKGSMITIFSETREEWLISALGAIKCGIIVCTLYPTLSDAALIHALNETEVDTMIISCDTLKRVASIQKECSSLETVIIIEDQLAGVGDTSVLRKDLKLVAFSEFINTDADDNEDKNAPAGKESNFQNNKLITNNAGEDDTVILMYTSGSTGIPKGVEISHKNILTCVYAFADNLTMGPTDRYLAYLPLAHIMELASEISCVFLGCPLLYSSPSTLTSKSTKIAKGCYGDAKVARPTFLMSVPLIMDRVIKGVMQTVEQKGWIMAAVFKCCVRYKPWLPAMLARCLDYLVFRNVQEELGGCLKGVGVGGAPLTRQSHEFLRAILGCEIKTGYGSTETTSCATGMIEGELNIGHVGSPVIGVKVKLVDWEEGDYKANGDPPRGEIIVGGNMVAKGYFKRPQETADAFYEENGTRWFRSGDIGEMTKEGCVKLIDRKKDFVKLKHGEYVSLVTVESHLNTHPLVENCVVFADSTQDYVVCVVTSAKNNIEKFCRQKGVNFTLARNDGPSMTGSEIKNRNFSVDKSLTKDHSHNLTHNNFSSECANDFHQNTKLNKQTLRDTNNENSENTSHKSQTAEGEDADKATANASHLLLNGLIPKEQTLQSIPAQNKQSENTSKTPDSKQELNTEHCFEDKFQEVLNKLMLKEIREFCRKLKLSTWETPKAVHVTLDQWLPDTGLVTPSMKVRRSMLYKKYKHMVDKMYQRTDQIT